MVMYICLQMMWSLLLVLLYALLLTDTARANAQGRLCGSDLADALSLVCADTGFHAGKKRAEPGMDNYTFYFRNPINHLKYMSLI